MSVASDVTKRNRMAVWGQMLWQLLVYLIKVSIVTQHSPRGKQSDTLFKGTKLKPSEPETGIWKGSVCVLGAGGGAGGCTSSVQKKKKHHYSRHSLGFSDRLQKARETIPDTICYNARNSQDITLYVTIGFLQKRY